MTTEIWGAVDPSKLAEYEQELAEIKKANFDFEPRNGGISLGTLIQGLESLAQNYEEISKVPAAK